MSSTRFAQICVVLNVLGGVAGIVGGHWWLAALNFGCAALWLVEVPVKDDKD